MKLIDLSHPLDARLYPHGTLGVKVVKTVEEHGVNTREVTLFNHIGTHVDAPLHLVAGSQPLDRMPLDRFYGSAVVLDIPKGPNGAVTLSDLMDGRPPIERGDIVVICTGWAGRIGTPEYATHHPYLTTEAAEWLVTSGVRMVGIDVQSVDLPHSLREPGFRYTSLRVLLENGIPAVMNLANLESIRGRRITLFALPILLTGLEGAPARVVAQVD